MQSLLSKGQQFKPDQEQQHPQSQDNPQSASKTFTNNESPERQEQDEYQQDSPSMEFELRLEGQEQQNFGQQQDFPTHYQDKSQIKGTASINLFKVFNNDIESSSQNNHKKTNDLNSHKFQELQIKNFNQDKLQSSIQKKLLSEKYPPSIPYNSQLKPSQNSSKQVVSLSQFQSEKKFYQDFQQQGGHISSSQESQSSIDSEASFARMNARRTMLLSDDFYGNNQYSAIIDDWSTEQCRIVHQCSKKIAHLQSLIKRQTILLQFQEKTKNERIKEIQYSYINAFNNFLALRNVKNKKLQSNPVLLNQKDLLQIHDQFINDLKRIKQVLGQLIFDQQENQEISFKKSIASSQFFQIKNLQQKITIKSIFSNEIEPPQTFLIDFNNFFPCWYQNIYQLMEMQFDTHLKIQNTFQSEYTIASKILSTIRYKQNIQRFCQIIFRKPLEELKKIKTQLIVDFSVIYEKWSNNLFNIPNSNPIKQFMEGKYLLEEGTGRNALTQQLGKFFGEKMEFSEYEKLLIQLNHFAKNRNAMNFLFNEIGRQEIEGEQINLRLALLVFKKMQINRRKLQHLSLLFINQIIQNYGEIPVEIKHVMQVFKKLARKKLENEGQDPVIKFQDLKSFFNKILFSQLFFTAFMQQLRSNSFQPQRSQSSSFLMSYQDHNITMIALLAQKIMFGQEFYEKFKYGYFNTIIKDYAPKIKQFIQNFAENEVIRFEKRKEIECMLLSLESIKFLYQSLRKKDMIKELVSFEKRFMNTKTNNAFALGSSKYTQEKMYVNIVYKPEFNYTSIFRPKQKFRRTFIEFLTIIESINDGVTFREVLEQYKCMEEDNLEIAKPSVQIYANYLSSFQKSIESQNIVNEIEQAIAKTKIYIEKVKICLERQHNIAINLEHIYKSTLTNKKKVISKETLEDYINLLFNLPLQFDYYVIQGKICERETTSSKKKERIIKDCLNDVAQFFGKNLQGLDALYSLLLQKIIQEVSKQGVVDENIIQSAQNIIGQKLYKLINLSNIQTQQDKKLFNSMKKHRFINLKMFALPQYIDEEEIVLDLSLQILQKLKHPMSPDKMIECLYEVTLVFQNVISCVGKASDITSDVQIPLMQLVLTKSMIPNLDTIMTFIKTFSHNDSGSNKYGMVLALVESICYLIETMNAEHLGLSEAEYMGYIENEYVIVD